MKPLKTLARHWMILPIALLASACSFLPSFLAKPSDTPGSSLWVSANNDWYYYVARVNNLRTGTGDGNPFLIEHASDPYPSMSGGEQIEAVAGSILHVDPITFQIILDGLLPFVITLLAYALWLKLSGSRFVACLIPAFLLVTNLWHFEKPIHPQINFPILLIFLLSWISLLRLFEKEHRIPRWADFRKHIGWIIVCGISLGILYLTYLFDWSFLWVVLGCSALLPLIKKDWAILKLNSIILAISSPFLVWYAVLAYRATHFPFATELSERLGVYHSHLPETLPRTVIALLACFFFFWFLRAIRQRDSYVGQSVLALLLANAIYPNHQVITGIIIETAAHWSFMPIFVFSLGVAYIATRIRPTRSRRILICGVLFIGVFAFAAYRLWSYLPSPFSESFQARYDEIQRTQPIMEYLQEHTPAESVVLAHSAIAYLIPTYTHNNIYYTEYITNFLPASNTELMERYLLNNFADPTFFQDPHLGIEEGRQGVLWGSPRGIEGSAQAVAHTLHIPYTPDDRYGITHEQSFAHEVLNNLTATVPITLHTLKRYRVDYVIWDKQRNPSWQTENDPGLERLYEQNDLVIYAVK
ncbi:MAG: hypothetical protein ABIO72_04765 [Patescibacteria group bacterium]